MRLRRYSRTLHRYIYPTDQALAAELPDRPAALRLFTGGVAWAVGLDFDAKGHGPAAVATHAADAAQLFTKLGGRVIVDVARSGGRHVWVPLAVPMTLHQAQQLAHACRRLWPTLDISSLVNAGEGCLTAPGSPCKDGRYRTLITPLPAAVEAVTRRSAHDLLDRALQLLASLIGTGDREHLDARPATAVPNGGAGRPLGPIHARIAELGTWPTDRTTEHGRPWTRSEACYAVLCAAARRGYTEHDVLHRLETGQWSGLLDLYTGRYRHQWRRRLRAEWTKARQAADTSSTHPTQAPQATGGQVKADAERDFARRWLAIMITAVDQLAPGRTRHNTQALVWALAWLAWRTGRRYVQAGTRSYARGCAGLLDHSTAADLLRHLRDLPPDLRPVHRLSTGRGVHGDLYQLVIPPAYAHLATDPATWPQPRPIPAVFGVPDPDRPRTRLLGSTGWRVYRALTSGATGTAAHIARAAGVSRAEAYAVLPILARLRLAKTITTSPGTASGCGGTRWEAGDRNTDQAGGEVDATEHLAQLDARHRAERHQWRQVLAEYAERRANTASHTPQPEPDEPLWWPPDWAQHEPEPDQPPPGADAPAGGPGAAGEAGDGEAAALALLADVFGAQPITAAPQRRPALRWLAHDARRHRESQTGQRS